MVLELDDYLASVRLIFFEIQVIFLKVNPNADLKISLYILIHMKLIP